MNEMSDGTVNMLGKITSRVAITNEEGLAQTVANFVTIAGPGSRVVIPLELDPSSAMVFEKAVRAAGATAIPATSRKSWISPPAHTGWPSDRMHDVSFDMVVVNKDNDTHIFTINIDYKRHVVRNRADYRYHAEITSTDISSELTRVINAAMDKEMRALGWQPMSSMKNWLGNAKTSVRERSESTAGGFVERAARIAGPNFGWTLEAWQADLGHGPFGRDVRFSTPQKLLYATGLLLFTAPRLRLMPMTIRLGMLPGKIRTWAVRAFDAWLASAMALGLTICSVLGWLAWTAYESAAAAGGFNAGVTSATTTVTIVGGPLVGGLLWLRHRRRPNPAKDER